MMIPHDTVTYLGWVETSNQMRSQQTVLGFPNKQGHLALVNPGFIVDFTDKNLDFATKK